ncbi:MAG: tetratricopeptide repeat protein [Spirochaetota bacterium]
MTAFKERNFYSARLLLQEIVLKDGRGEYGDDAQYYLGMTYFYEGDYRTAQFEFKALQRDFPDSPFVVRAAFWNGEAWFYRKQYREALEAHAAFVRKHRENALCASALYTIGFIYNEQKRYDEAVQEFTRALRDYPETPVAPALTLQLGIARFNSQEYSEARRAFETLLVKYTQAENLDAARFWLGKSFFAENKFDEAMREFTAVRRDFPASEYAAEAVYLAALCRYRQGNLPEANELLARAAADFPQSPIYPFVRLRQAQLAAEKSDETAALPPLIDIMNNHRAHETFAPALDLFAEVRRKQGKIPDALATFEALGNEKNLSGKNRKEVLRRHGDLLYSEGRFAEAGEKYELLAKEFPSGNDGASHYLLLGRTRLKEGKFEAALAALSYLEKNYEDSAAQADALYLKAEISYQQGKFTQALQLYSRFVKKHRNHARATDAEMGIGWTYFELKQFARAADHFRRLLKNEQSSTVRSKALLALGACLYNLRDLDGAEAGYREIISQYASEKTEYAEAIYQLAWLNFRRSKPQEAGEDFRRYLALGAGLPRNAEATYFSALCLLQTGNYQEAESALADLAGAPATPAWIREKALADLAKSKAALKQLAPARATWQQLLAEYPESAMRDEARYHVTALSLRLGDEQLAITEADKLRGENPESAWFAETLSELANYYRQRREFAKATAVLKELGAAKKKPDEKLEVQLTRAQVLLDQGEHEEGERMLRAVMRNEEAREETVIRAAQLLFGRFEASGNLSAGTAEAEAMAQRFAESFRLRDEMRLASARFRFLQQQYAECRETLLPLLKNRDTAGRARFMLGEVSLVLNDTQKAMDYFRQISQKQDASIWLKARLMVGEILYARKEFEEAAREFSRIAYAENRDNAIFEKSLWRAALAFRAIGKQREFETFRAKLREAFPQSPYNKELE